MPTRRAVLRGAGAAAAVVALTPDVPRAQARKPVLTIALPSTPETIDPHQFRSVLSGSILNLMGEGLLTRDPNTMELKPLLADLPFQQIAITHHHEDHTGNAAMLRRLRGTV